MRNRILMTMLAGWTVAAQTQIDLRTQAKSVDFSAASSTKPLKTGGSLPATCAVGEVFFNTSAAAGANFYACTAANQWSSQGGISGQNCWVDSSTNVLKCQDAQGNVYATVKTSSNGTTNQWVDYISPSGVPHTSQPTAGGVGAVADPGQNGIPYRSGAGTAAAATADKLSGPFFCQDAGSSSAYQCSLTPAIGGYAAGTLYWFRANTANSGPATISFNGLAATSIKKLTNQGLVAGDIKAGQWVVVTYDGTNMQMQSQSGTAPGVTSVFGRSGTVSAGSGDYTTAQVTESGNLYFTNARVRAAVSAAGPLTFNSSTGAFDCPGCLTTSTSADTDVTGTFPHLSVTRLQGKLVSGVSPADQQYLGWNGLVLQWEPKSIPVQNVFGRTGTISAQSGDYTAAQVSNAVDQTANYANPAWIASLAWGKITGAPSTFTPTAHAGTHGALGSDPLTLDASQVATGVLSSARLPGSAMQTNQSNSITGGTQDFSGASHTLPMKTGTMGAMPATCSVGETYFATDAAAGGNVYGCTAVNSWSALGAGGASANLAVENSGSMVGSRSTINLIPGSGFTTIMTDTGSQINMQMALDSAVMETQPNEQAGRALLCASSGGASTNYQCSMSPTLGAYAAGMMLHWLPDVNGAGGATTLNVDTLGAAPLKMPDGATNPSVTDIVGGRMYSIWYDGAVFRMSGSQASFSYTPENLANKGQPNGYAGLDSTGKVAAAQLPATTPMASQTASVNFTPVFDGACEDKSFTFTGVTGSTQLVAGLPSNLPAGVDAILFVNAPNSVDVRLCNHSGATQNMGSYTFTAKTPSYVLTASASLGFGSVADGACGSQTFALSGANAGDPVAAGYPASLAAGLAGSMTVSSSNTVSVLLCNYSGSAWSAAPQTFTATIVK